MTHETMDDIVTSLDALLEAERGALLEGALDRLPILLDEKARLIDSLNTLRPDDEDRLGDIRTKVTRNQALLEGALQGIRKVADRLATVRRLRHSFDTYDESGHRQTIDGDVVRRIERRA